MTLPTKYIDLCGIVFLSALLGLGSFYIYSDHRDTKQKNKLELQLLATQRSELTIAQNNVETLKSVITGHRAALVNLNRRIPDDPRIGLFLTEIHQLIRQHKVEMTQFNYESPVRIDRYQRIPLHMALEGNFLDIYRLIHGFETLNRLFIIDSIQMSQLKDKDVCQTQLAASIFFD